MSITEEVRAAAAAHHDLGPVYDTAVAEGLVERIGEEIDKRVDARLYGQEGYPGPPLRRPGPPLRRRPRREPMPGRVGFGAVVLALGSMGMAIGATAAVLHPGTSDGQVSGGAGVLIALIWIVIAAINIAYARQRLRSSCQHHSYQVVWASVVCGQRRLWRLAAGCSVRSWAATTRRKSAPPWPRTRIWVRAMTTPWPKGWSSALARKSTSG